MAIQAVIFDMDGVLIDSEVVWEEERVEYARLRGKQWDSIHQVTLMGGNSQEWASGMQRIMALEESVPVIIEEMLQRMSIRYEQNLPVIPGAVEAVRRMASRYKVGLASGSAKPVIESVLRLTGLDRVFKVVVSGDEMTHGKPAPDIYFEAARQLGVAPEQCAGIEDSGNGMRALKAAGMRAIAIPQVQFMPKAEILALADVRLDNIDQLTFEVIEG